MIGQNIYTKSRFLSILQSWTGWKRIAAFSVCSAIILALGIIRSVTDAEYTFASLALLPVLVIAWMGGNLGGYFAAILAAAIWLVADIASERQFSAAWVPWVNGLTRLLTYSLVAGLAIRVRNHFEQTHEIASTDSLTGLQNRRSFLNEGRLEAVRSKRYSHTLAVVFMDLDDFKALNDTKGHHAGDSALRATAKALLTTLRATDLTARLGGDEFAVLLPEIGYEDAVKTGNKISAAVKSALTTFPPVSVSLGVAWFAQTDRPFPAMLQAADELMYAVKNNGKGSMLSQRF